MLRPIWYMILNISFQFLNNITHIFIHFLTYMYLKKKIENCCLNTRIKRVLKSYYTHFLNNHVF